MPMRGMRISGAVGKWIISVMLFVSSGCVLAAQTDKVRSDDREYVPPQVGAPIAREPIFVYNNWSAYDELSDNIPLTERLTMKELDEILRLRKLGARFDYYTIDAFWFDPDGGYRTWRKPNWPSGPDAWIRKCRENGILPGLWFSTNTLVKINAAPEWRDSLTENKGAMSFFEGGFLSNFMETLQYWYDRGIRIYKFDFVDFGAATPATAKTMSAEEIHRRNETAFRDALKKFRARNADVVLVAFNGFGGDVESTADAFPFHNVVDLRWLEVFDSMYSGDPRPSDVPEMDFWRSTDIYSDHMVRRYEQSFVPLERIDSTGFMLGNTGTIYYRKTHAWKGAFILMMARGGWVNTVYGSLEFLSDDDARWMAKVQSLYLPLQANGRTKTFGGIPGDVKPYGFGSLDADGAVYVAMNPAQSIETIRLPRLSREEAAPAGGRIIFRDAGFEPVLAGDSIRLGPGEMAVIGFGKYADKKYELGVQEDVRIPRSIALLPAKFSESGKNAIRAEVIAPAAGDLRIVMQQRSAKDGSIMRSWKEGPPNGTNMGKVFVLTAVQGGKTLPVEINYDKVIWSGLSWAVGEVRHGELKPGVPVEIECRSGEEAG
ncbi:MAG TPA: hypothetical protein VMT67_05900, partial [Terriglobales bacterium]|nr:hypothetical protein [Terriglobales bacterium]